VCAFFCVVLSCVLVEVLRRADRPSKESYKLSIQIHKFQKINSEPEQVKRPSPSKTTTTTTMMTAAMKVTKSNFKVLS
jgi:hypothetical protein